jgi:hypothetical protein
MNSVGRPITPCALALLGYLVLVAPAAQAARLDQWGTYTLTTGLLCPDTRCRSPSDLFEGPEAVAPQGRAAAIAFSNGTYGASRASANLGVTPGLNVPLLRAEASGAAGAGTTAVARGVDAYSYRGTSAKTIDLLVTLTGDVDNPNDTFLTQLIADVYVMEAEMAEALGGEALLLRNGLPTPTQTSIGLQAGAFPIVVGVVSFDVNPGDSFYVHANLSAAGFNQGSADAYSTLTLSFGDAASDLVAVSAIPLPAAGWLLGPAFTVLLALRRRGRRTA